MYGNGGLLEKTIQKLLLSLGAQEILLKADLSSDDAYPPRFASRMRNLGLELDNIPEDLIAPKTLVVLHPDGVALEVYSRNPDKHLTSFSVWEYDFSEGHLQDRQIEGARFLFAALGQPILEEKEVYILKLPRSLTDEQRKNLLHLLKPVVDPSILYRLD